MGTEATVGRRTLVKVVDNCIGAVNDCNARVTTVETAHNQLSDAIDTHFAALEKRITAQGAWCEKNENAAVALAEVDTALEAKLRTVCEAFLQAVAQTQLEAAAAVASKLPPEGFFGRLRWLLFGPVVEHPYAGVSESIDPDLPTFV